MSSMQLRFLFSTAIVKSVLSARIDAIMMDEEKLHVVNILCGCRHLNRSKDSTRLFLTICHKSLKLRLPDS